MPTATCPAHATILTASDAVEYSVQMIPAALSGWQTREEWRSDAWHEVCRMFAQFNPGKHPNVPFAAHVGMYLPARMLRIASNRYRKESRQVQVQQNTLEALPEPDSRHQTADTMGLGWYDPEFCRARERLTWKHRILLALRHREGWHPLQIAELFGMSDRGVRDAFASAYDTLSQHMEYPQ